MKGNVLRLISKIKYFIGSFFTKIKDFIDSFFTEPITKSGAITLISSVFLLGFSFLLLISDQYGHEEAWPFTLLGYCLFLCVPFERNLKITFSVGLAGVVATAWVGIVSTDRIKDATQEFTKKIQTTTEKYIEKSTKDIQEALYPNNFEFYVHEKGGWCKPVEVLGSFKDKSGKKRFRVKLTPKVMTFETRKINLDMGIWNKSKYHTPDILIIISFKKGQFKETIDDIEALFNQVSRKAIKAIGSADPFTGYNIALILRLEGFIPDDIIWLRRVLGMQTIGRIPLHMKEDKAQINVRVNNDNFYEFHFEYKPKDSSEK